MNNATGDVYVVDKSDKRVEYFTAEGKYVGDQLLPSDTDTRVNVYDARVGGGFPVSQSPLEMR